MRHSRRHGLLISVLIPKGKCFHVRILSWAKLRDHVLLQRLAWPAGLAFDNLHE